MRPPPPPGPPWDLPIDEAPLAFVDLEMTGLDVNQDRVVEVCIERVRHGAIEGRLSTVVRPPVQSGAGDRIHGIAKSALEQAPPFSEIAAEAENILADAVFVAHAAEWDIKFLSREMRCAGRTFRMEHYLDTLTLARRSFAAPSYALTSLATQLGLPHDAPHRAASDVTAMRALFEHCRGLLEPKSPRDLWEVRIAERVARSEIVKACEIAAGQGTPVVLTYRPSGRAPIQIEVVVKEVLSGFDPPRVLVYQLPGRGRRELRADRILRVDAPVAEPS